jgi:inorganic phosphate transporter, PiT family
MDLTLWLIVILIAIALIFDFTNGFHDAANAIATVVATEALTLRQALLMAALCNLGGAFFSTQVARTIETEILNPLGDPLVGQLLVLAALLGAIAWNLMTWRFGMPSSSSHALIGGLVGAGLALGSTQSVQWQSLVEKVLLPMLLSPLLGALLAAGLLVIVSGLLHRWPTQSAQNLLQRLQVGAGALMAWAHGANDAQKTMGVITLALIQADWLPSDSAIPWWVILICAIALSLGTYAGGQRIIITTGEKITQLNPLSGFVANLGSSLTLSLASLLGFPISTTQVVIGSISGAGYTAHRLQTEPSASTSPIRWQTWQRMVWAWVLTLPGSGAIAALCYWGLIAVSQRPWNQIF